MDKKKQVKRFTFFTQKQLELYSESLKEVSAPERLDMKNKTYLSQVKQIYYDLRLNEGEKSKKRNKKALSKTKNSTSDFLRKNTMCYNNSLYPDFEGPVSIL